MRVGVEKRSSGWWVDVHVSSVVNTENSAAPIIGYIAISWDSPHISFDREDGPGYVSGTHCYLVSAGWRMLLFILRNIDSKVDEWPVAC
jgi:hypothetical protein